MEYELYCPNSKDHSRFAASERVAVEFEVGPTGNVIRVLTEDIAPQFGLNIPSPQAMTYKVGIYRCLECKDMTIAKSRKRK